jgi:hypothetical protein
MPESKFFSASQIMAFENTWEWNQESARGYEQIIGGGPHRSGDDPHVFSVAPCNDGLGRKVTLAALLTLFSILLAVLAVARPVGRRSLALFFPLWRVLAAILASFAFIVCRDAPFGVIPPFGWSLSTVTFGLTVGAFIIPVLAGLWGWASWERAKLTSGRIRRVENVFRAALREPFGCNGNQW